MTLTSHFFAVEQEQAEVQFLSFGPNHGSPTTPTLYRLPSSSSAVDVFLSLHPAAAAAPDRRYRGHSVPPISSYYSLLTQRAPCFNKSIRSAPRLPHPRTDTAYDSPPAALAPCTKLHSAGSTGPRPQHSRRNSKVLSSLAETNSLWSIVRYGIEPIQQPLS